MKRDDKKIVETILVLLKSKEWKSLSLKEIKKKSNINQFDKLIKSKKELIKKINEYFDYKLSLELKNIEQSNNKDMIFEILMMRFDILQNYRKGVISIFQSFKSKPQDILFLLPNILDSIILMINVTNISSKGVTGTLRVKGILLIYISSFLVWMKDDTSSLEKTMIALDKNLDQAGKMLGFINAL